MQTQPANTPSRPTLPWRSALIPCRVKCAGLQYIALATGPAQAIADAIALHGVARASARPVKGGVA